MNLEVRFLLVFYEIYLRKKEGVQEALLKSVATLSNSFILVSTACFKSLIPPTGKTLLKTRFSTV